MRTPLSDFAFVLLVAFGISLLTPAVLVSLGLRIAAGVVGALIFVHHYRPGLFVLPGYFLNCLVLAANGGTMPVAAEHLPVGGHIHVALTAHSRLVALADILPGGSSLGDWLILGGLLCGTLWVTCRRGDHR
jgi:Family of unknown function (DUF5317)